MSSDYVVTGNLSTVVALKYTGGDLAFGKWKSQPNGHWPVGTTQFFAAENRDGNQAPPEGWVEGLAADGTRFKFTFDDPVSRENYCSSSMSHVNGKFILPTPSYPKSGKTWTVTYYIKFGAAEFADPPVFPEDVVQAPKCDLFPDARVKALLGTRTSVYLKDALEMSELHPADKLWCATSALFLTPSAKALLTRDLAQAAVQELSAAARQSVGTIDPALQLNRDFAAGHAGWSALSAMRAALEEKRHASLGNARDAELLDAIVALADPDPQAAWSGAASSYLGDAKDDALAERTGNLLRLVTARL